MDFLEYWDTRIEANKRLFGENPNIANFAYDECELLFDYMAKELEKLKEENKLLKNCLSA